MPHCAKRFDHLTLCFIRTGKIIIAGLNELHQLFNFLVEFRMTGETVFKTALISGHGIFEFVKASSMTVFCLCITLSHTRPAPPETERKPGQRGRLKRSKSRNLLERLKAFKDDVLRFMTREDIPYTNNQGERDLRMAKVQQKISGCFRSETGARVFCRVRGYVSTCRKQGLSATDAIKMALAGELPSFDTAE